MSEKHYFEDIICARATPPGASAISVIRVSGRNSWKILLNIFRPAVPVKNITSHKIYHGTIIDNNDAIDNVLVLTFRENSGFTGEESFEINCHGSEVTVAMILKILVKNGARPAEPGEFSKRAFLNGKIDLAEAEAIMDLVNSSTNKSALIAARQLNGKLSDEINALKKLLTDIIAEIEVNIDYPEEDLSIDMENILSKIKLVDENLENLMKGFKRGRYFREGIKAVILGKTNSGKSTLFNLLLNEDKAIVSDIHGTTRDYLDGVINISGYGIRIYDTAGLRDTDDPIEKEGASRALELSKNADVAIYVISSNNGLTDEDRQNITGLHNEKIIFVLNKTDLIDDSALESLEKDVSEFLKTIDKFVLKVNLSALKKTGLDDFNNVFIRMLINDNITDTDDPVMTNERHAVLIEDARSCLNHSVDNIKKGLLDLSGFELREALNRLGEITGEVTTEDILDRIFSGFCVGK